LNIYLSIPGHMEVCTTYILVAPEGFRLGTTIAYPAGVLVAVPAFILLCVKPKPAP